MTMNALDKCYELGRAGAPPPPLARHAAVTDGHGFAHPVGRRVLLPVGGVVKAWIISKQWPGLHKGSPWLLAFDIARWVLAIPFMISILTVLYHWGPNVRHRFHWMTPGAVFSIVVWVALGLAFKLYLERFVNYNKTYGTVGGAAVLLLFFYIDAAVLLGGRRSTAGSTSRCSRSVAAPATSSPRRSWRSGTSRSSPCRQRCRRSRSRSSGRAA